MAGFFAIPVPNSYLLCRRLCVVADLSPPGLALARVTTTVFLQQFTHTVNMPYVPEATKRLHRQVKIEPAVNFTMIQLNPGT